MSFVWKVHAGYEESVGTARHNILLFNLAAASYVYVQKSYILNLIHFEDHNIYYTGKSLSLIFLRKVFFSRKSAPNFLVSSGAYLILTGIE